ncbi:hypothetical protein BGZ49_010846, partial [Haplosporangium sp. Z 27]
MLRQSAFLPTFLCILVIAPLIALSHPFFAPFHRKHNIDTSIPQQQQQQQQQLIFDSHHNNRHSFEQPIVSQQPQQQQNEDSTEYPDEVLTMRHILHHGGRRYPKLFRRLDFSPEDILLNELLTGRSMSHQLKVQKTTTIKPRGEKFKSFRSRGFRAVELSPDQSFGPETWTREEIIAPNITDKETIVQLSMINYNSYTEVASPG